MKKIIILIILFPICNFIIAQTPCIVELELIDSVLYYKGKIYSGDYECFDENGNLQRHGYIKNGQLDSINEYYKNGNLTEKVWFVNGKPTKRTLYQDAITSKLIINLNGNIEDGIWERYFMNGKLNEQKYFDNGKAVGIWSTWDNLGRITMVTDFTNDPIITKYHSYSNRKHKILIRYIDKHSGKTIKKEKANE